MTRTPDERRRDRDYLRELYRRIVAWDPIGLIGIGAPEDEYDCMLGPIVSDLRDDLPPRRLAQVLRTRFSNHFGEEPSDAERFAAEITEWHQSTRSN